MDSNVKINPCKMVLEKYKDNLLGNKQSINDLCNETVVAFNGHDALFSKDNPCKLCSPLLFNYQQGYNYDQAKQYYPSTPSWNNSIHYFPGLYKNNKDITASYNTCIDQCVSNNHNSINQCKDNCINDMNAVKFVNNQQTSENFKYTSSTKNNSYNDYAKDKPITFYITLVIILLMLTPIIVLILHALTYNN